MTLPTRAIEPTLITAGEKVEWYKDLADYPATLWTLTYKFRGPGVGMNLTATADSSTHVVSAAAATTALMTTAGRFQWQAMVTKISDSTDKRVIGSGWTKVVQAFATSTATVETRSIAKQIIDTIDAAMLTADGGTIEYTISTPAGSKKVVRASREEALKTRTYYASIYAQEQARDRARNGGSLMQSVGVRFTDV